MAISTAFQEAIDLVDDTMTLSFATDADYGEAEYSCNGLAVTGGSDMACEIGAAALLDAMGFRFYTPHSDFWKLPASIPTGITIARQSNWIPANRIFLVYGHAWAGTNTASRTLLGDRYAKWATLVGANNDVYPVGHRWGNIITSNAAFFAANPALIRQTAGGVNTFDLGGIEGTADYDLLVEFCAAFLLSAGLNEFGRTNFDPVDGDDNTSDQVYPFASAVAMKMREGTEAIGGISAQAGVPGAAIGVYAYAGHRVPPSEPYPGVYTQVAFAFTELDLGDLLAGHAALADAIAAREYLDTQTFTNGNPMANIRAKTDYLDTYDTYPQLAQVNSEFAAHWLVNMVQARAAILKFRTGETDYAAIIDEMVNDIFGGDQAAKDLYTYWSDPDSLFHKWSLKPTFDYVNAMSGWHKVHFQRLCAIIYKFLRISNAADYGIVRNPGEEDDTFEAEISELLSWITAVRDDDIYHSYAFIRQEANSALNDYPHLKFNAVPEPDWFATPSAPTAQDFADAYAAIVTDSYRPSELDDDELVLINVEPTAAAVSDFNEPAKAYVTWGRARFMVAGPAIVTITNIDTEAVEVRRFGKGLTQMKLQGIYRTEWAKGMVFLDTFPLVRKEPDGANQRHWLYVPPFVAGEAQLLPKSRWALYDQDGQRKDWLPGLTFPDVGPGQVAIDNGNTRGNFTNVNCNRWVSPHPNFALVPKVMLKGRYSTIRVTT